MNGNLTQTFMRIGGQWVDVTSRVTVPGQTQSIPNDSMIYLVPLWQKPQLYPRKILAFYCRWLLYCSSTQWERWIRQFLDPKPIAPDNAKRHLTCNRLHGRRLEINPDLPAPPSLSNATAKLRYTDPTRLIDTSSLRNPLRQIQLTPNNNQYQYNISISANELFEPDPFGVEVFIKNRS